MAIIRRLRMRLIATATGLTLLQMARTQKNKNTSFHLGMCCAVLCCVAVCWIEE